MQKEYYKQYAVLEKEHWWFKARLGILKKLISEFLNKNKQHEKLNILNIGVATGQTSFMLKEFGSVTSLEYDEDCCEYLRKEVGMEVVQGSATELPFDDNTFDMVCAFDVIEHIKDHEKAISEISRVLKPKAQIFVTVPAYMFLWSDHDVINMHFRRYTLSEIISLTEPYFENDYSSYFNTILFPVASTVRLLGNAFKSKKSETRKVKSDFENYSQGSFSNKLLYRIFKFEKNMLGRLKFPFGVSLLYTGKNNKMK